LNNYESRDEVEVLNNHSDYHVYGFEVGESGTPHVQGFVCLKKRMRLTGLKKILPRAHFEVAKGSVTQNVEYCSKELDVIEYGSKPADCAIADKWKRTRQLATEGRFEEIPDDMFVRYNNAIKRIRQDHPVHYPALPNCCGEWYSGKSGAGKSSYARETYKDRYYLKPCNKWWDGYQDEEIVLIEDLDKKHEILGHHLKLWADHYDFPAEQKGTTVVIRPQKIIVTSQYAIYEIFEDEQTRTALQRRFKEFVVRNGVPVPVTRPTIELINPLI